MAQEDPGPDGLRQELDDGEGVFGELIRFSLPDYLHGLLLGVVLDRYGLQTSPVGNWLVRTLAGER